MLVPGSALGPYEILSFLGAGGMGEVYRARDPRLGREVAIKVLPSRFTSDRNAMARFEREVRAVAALSHPNILAIHDFGNEEGKAFAVMELLEGESLREAVCRGPLPPRKAVEYAVQIARGLGAAHDKGIVHRDLKPENVFLTRTGLVKILDFGLAKLRESDAAPIPDGNDGDTGGLEVRTDVGMVMGTVGYMSPEQVRGEAVDGRSDIFAFGCVLYEMLSGRRPFGGATRVEVLHAALKEAPPELPSGLPSALPRIVRGCLEKDAGARFRSAHDVAFALETLAGPTGGGPEPVPLPDGNRHRVGIALAGVMGALLVGGAFAAGQKGRPDVEPPRFRRLTFARGFVTTARFGAEGRTAVYSARWGAEPERLFSTPLQGTGESTPLAVPPAELADVSSTGELAVFLGGAQATTISRLRPGESPRAVGEVTNAEWAPDGRLCVTRHAEGFDTLELPPGHVLYKTVGMIGGARVSPRGDLVTFWEKASPADHAGELAVVDAAGTRRTLARLPRLPAYWARLAWNPGGSEVWFSPSTGIDATTISAVDLSGKARAVATLPGWFWLNDISESGEVLVTRIFVASEMKHLPPGETIEHDVSWQDDSLPRALSSDGNLVLFGGEGGLGTASLTYVRRLDGSPPVRLGEGSPRSLSPDGQWALAIDDDGDKLVLLPVGAGEVRSLATGSVHPSGVAHWVPSGDIGTPRAQTPDSLRTGPALRIAFEGRVGADSDQWWVVDVLGGAPRPLPGPRGSTVAFSPDGKFVLGTVSPHHWRLFPLDGGASQPVPDLPGRLLRFTANEQEVFTATPDGASVQISRVDLATGRAQPWRTLRPGDPTGIRAVHSVMLTPDGQSFVYGFNREICDLYLVTGLR